MAKASVRIQPGQVWEIGQNNNVRGHSLCLVLEPDLTNKNQGGYVCLILVDDESGLFTSFGGSGNRMTLWLGTSHWELLE